MTMSLRVSSVLKSGNTYNRGRFRLAVMGRLLVKEDVALIVDDVAAVDEICRGLEGDEDDKRAIEAEIRIADSSFLPKLQTSLSPRSGGLTCSDPVTVCGSTRLEGDEIVLDHVWEAIVYRDGSMVWVIGSPPSDSDD